MVKVFSAVAFWKKPLGRTSVLVGLEDFDNDCAVNEAKVQTANTIRARALRPMEGAAGNAAAVTVKSDVTKLSKEDREERNSIDDISFRLTA